MKRGHSQISSWMVRIFCAIALAFGGLASGSLPIDAELPSAADQQTADLAAYILPDGTIPTLCVTVNDDQGVKHGTTGHLHGCDACEITLVAFLLPEPPTGPSFVARHVPQTILAPSAPVIFARAHPPNANPRAPPLADLLA
ncbi:MAG: hypothetical protein PW791_01975 [Neorhizobium sp.]|nr:hypothetical protein [Neorhizobium sp.]